MTSIHPIALDATPISTSFLHCLPERPLQSRAHCDLICSCVSKCGGSITTGTVFFFIIHLLICKEVMTMEKITSFMHLCLLLLLFCFGSFCFALFCFVLTNEKYQRRIQEWLRSQARDPEYHVGSLLALLLIS